FLWALVVSKLFKNLISGQGVLPYVENAGSIAKYLDNLVFLWALVVSKLFKNLISGQGVLPYVENAGSIAKYLDNLVAATGDRLTVHSTRMPHDRTTPVTPPSTSSSLTITGHTRSQSLVTVHSTHTTLPGTSP
ncbi:Hypothetical predicted protein, partial [Olea europaea subsp. europaea]